MRAAVARLDGLGALDALLGDGTVDEVLVNAHGDVWVERDGHMTRAGHIAAADLALVTERILAPLGRRLDRTTPDRRRPPAATGRGSARSSRRSRPTAGACRSVASATARSTSTRSRPTPSPPCSSCSSPAGATSSSAGRPRRARPRCSTPRSGAARPASASSRSRTPSSCCRPPTTSCAWRPGPRRPDGPAADHARAAGAHGAAPATRPPRRRRGARSGGARPRAGPEHRPRRLVVDVPRQQRGRRAAPPGDPRRPGRAVVAARRPCAST